MPPKACAIPTTFASWSPAVTASSFVSNGTVIRPESEGSSPRFPAATRSCHWSTLRSRTSRAALSAGFRSPRSISPIWSRSRATPRGPNESAATVSMTCRVISPRTIAASAAWVGSWSRVSSGFGPGPNMARGARSPNPAGMTTAATAFPRRTSSRTSSVAVPCIRVRDSSPFIASTIRRERSLRSRSATQIVSREPPPSPAGPPPKMKAKNDARISGTANERITARRSWKNSCKSLRTSISRGRSVMGRAGSCP